MEFLIPGLILVGLMVWASTRIKRSAAKAFEREEIETAEFSLTKPEGFLSIVDPADGAVFSAYSKDFGVDGAEKMRRATAELRVFPNAQLTEIVESAKAGASAILSEQTGVIGGNKCANIIVERLEEGILLESHYNIVAGTDAVYRLTVNVLSDNKDEFRSRIDELLTSFSLS
jgi:hypothetical protein